MTKGAVFYGLMLCKMRTSFKRRDVEFEIGMVFVEGPKVALLARILGYFLTSLIIIGIILIFFINQSFIFLKLSYICIHEPFTHKTNW